MKTSRTADLDKQNFGEGSFAEGSGHGQGA
jgi:hypothetical protein